MSALAGQVISGQRLAQPAVGTHPPPVMVPPGTGQEGLPGLVTEFAREA
jgi:hypothetical protein